MEKNRKIHLICEGGIRMVSGCVLLALVTMNMLFSSYVDYQSERVHIEKNTILTLVVAVCFFCCMVMLSCVSESINQKRLFVGITAIVIVAGIYLIANSDGTLRADPLYAYETAVELLEGNYSSFAKDGYLFYFPHQLGIITYERVLLLFSSNTKLIFFCNLLEMIGINFFLWKLTDILFEHNHIVNINTIILSFIFLPQFFFILFAYGLIPGLFCLMVAFWGGAGFIKRRRKSCLAIMVFFSCLAVFLKENFLVGIIALVIWIFLECLENKRYKLVAVSLLLIPCCLFSVRAVKRVYELESSVKMGQGVPAMLYIDMGMNPDNEMLGPGWFDGSNWNYFTQCDQNSQLADEFAKKLFITYIKQMREEPVRSVKFFLKKSITIWCEPMYQSVWSGPLESCGQYMNTQLLQSLYRGEKVERIVYQYMKGYVMVVLTMSFLFLVKEWTKNRGTTLLLLYNMGGFLFHIFWEAKSQYVYPYIFVLIPLCAYMVAKLSCYLKEKIKNKF